MSLKQTLKISGASLFLYAVFGYLFPEWGGTVFSNNENLAHLLVAIALVIVVELSARWQTRLIVLLAIFFLALGLYGFAHIAPADILFKNTLIPAHLDTFDNYVHVLLGLFFGWFSIQSFNRQPRP